MLSHHPVLTFQLWSWNSLPFSLPQVFINLSNKGIDPDAFESIINSLLVFDHRLVINSAFQTRDSAVYAAGPLTKFSRCYHSDEWTHANFNSKEVGRDLAAMLLSLFDPTLEEDQSDVDRNIRLYEEAKIQGLIWVFYSIPASHTCTIRIDQFNIYSLICTESLNPLVPQSLSSCCQNI